VTVVFSRGDDRAMLTALGTIGDLHGSLVDPELLAELNDDLTPVCRGLAKLVEASQPEHRRDMVPLRRLAEQCLRVERVAWRAAILE
jgi:hypothetical protein